LTGSWTPSRLNGVVKYPCSSDHGCLPRSHQQEPAGPVSLGGWSFTTISESRGPSPTMAAGLEGQTLLQNGPPATIGGNRLFYSAGYDHVGTQSAQLPTRAFSQAGQDPTNLFTDGFGCNPIPAASSEPAALPITAPVASAGGRARAVVGRETVFSVIRPSLS